LSVLKLAATATVLLCTAALHAETTQAASATASAAPSAAAADATALWQTRCAACHDHPHDRIPPRVLISTIRNPEDIVLALSSGVMRQQASGLSAEQIRALATFLTGRAPGADNRDPNANRCRDRPPPLEIRATDWNGWGLDLANTRFQPRPGITAAELPRLKLRWVFAFPGATTFGQPVVVGGRVFAGGPGGRMFALDAQSGCTLWSYEAGALVRTAAVIGRVVIEGRPRMVAYFGDDKANLHAVDADTGAPIWKTLLDPHPLARLVGTPKLDEGRLLVPVSSMEEVAAADPTLPCCRFRGSLAALDPATGRKIWQQYSIAEAPHALAPNAVGTARFGPAGGAVFNSPTIDAARGLIYIGSGDSYTDVATDGTDAVLALDRASGARRWVYQAVAHDAWILGCDRQPHANCPKVLGGDLDFAASTVLLPGAHGMLIAAAKSGMVYGLDPDHGGRMVWRTKIARGSSNGSILWGLASEGGRSFIATNEYDFVTGHGPGALVAIDNATGKVAWRVPTPALPCGWGPQHCGQGQLGAVSAIPGALFSGSIDGRIRAYRTGDGRVLWEFDTGHAFPAVNGGDARGGGIDYGAQTIAEGMLFVQSGSMRQPGNALLAFSVDGR
jgi:polyvinyl alcohol dehydrogenase (cytochrome)